MSLVLLKTIRYIAPKVWERKLQKKPKKSIKTKQSRKPQANTWEWEHWEWEHWEYQCWDSWAKGKSKGQVGCKGKARNETNQLLLRLVACKKTQQSWKESLRKNIARNQWTKIEKQRVRRQKKKQAGSHSSLDLSRLMVSMVAIQAKTNCTSKPTWII